MLKSSNFLQELQSKVDCCLKSYFWLKQAALDNETKTNSTKIDFLKVNLSNCFLALEGKKDPLTTFKQDAIFSKFFATRLEAFTRNS